jgi:hypothetical protein
MTTLLFATPQVFSELVWPGDTDEICDVYQQQAAAFRDLCAGAETPAFAHDGRNKVFKSSSVQTHAPKYPNVG